MSINQPDLLRKAMPRAWRDNREIRNFVEQLVYLLSQTATATGETGDSGDTTIINEAESTVLSTVSRVDELDSQIDDLMRSVETPDNSDLEDRIEDLERQVVNLLTLPETGFYTANVDGGIYEATDREFITATLNATILLPSRPSSNSVIIVKKIDNSSYITVGGNGKNIDGSSSVVIRNKNTALTIQYNLKRDAWFIR